MTLELRLKFLDVLDTALHKSLDWYINRQLPLWGGIQVTMYKVCQAYEDTYDQVKKRDSDEY